MKPFQLLLFVWLAAVASETARAQYSYTTVVDSTMARPDGAANFFPCCYPAMENAYVVFADNIGTANESIWSKNLITGALTKLVDLNTHVPGGSGNFLGFETCQGEGKMIRLRNGTVLFFGTDAGAPHCSGGLYSVPVGGGPIKKVVDYHQTLPDGGTYTELKGLMSFDLLNGKVAFAVNTSSGNNGIFSGSTAGAAPVVVADTFTQYCYDPPTCGAPVYGYSQPAVSGSRVVFNGGNVFDPSTGYNNLMTAPIGGGTLTEIANSNQALPGDPTVMFHTRFHFPVVDGNTVYFVADDTDYSGPCGTFYGLFSMPVTGGAFTKVLDSCDSIPGISQINGSSSFEGASANQGTVVFDVLDGAGSSGNSIYSSTGGVVQRVIGGGDTLAGGVVNGNTVGNPGADATFGGRVAFETWTGNIYGLFLAAPPCAPIDTSEVSIVLGSLTYNPTTKIYSQTATVTNTSSAAIAGPFSLLVTNLTAGATMTNSNGVTICEAPANSPYINLNVKTLGKGKSTSVTLQFKDPSSGNITFTPQLAGPGAR